MQMKTKTIIISGTLILILIPILILMLDKTKFIQKPINQLAQAQYTTTIGTENFDITNAVLEPNEILPTISAGMIPVKWDGTNWVITTKTDKAWYDYSNTKPAYIMLNDGVYQSELTRDMTNKKLSEKHIEEQIQETELGTIYMWIPRYAYNEAGEILYIKQVYSVAGTWTIPETFIYTTNNVDFSLSGIWVEYKPLTSKSAVTTKVNNMKGEENKYGFISNTVGIGVPDDALIQTTIEKYINVVGNDALIVPTNDTENTYRSILKVVDTNKLEPIKGKAYYDKNEEKIKIEVTYRKNAISKILDENGNVLKENSTKADTGDEIIGNKVYKYIIIDNKGNQKEITLAVSGLDIYIIANLDDLKLFKDAVNAGKTTERTRAYQIADVKMNEGKYTIDETTGEITFAEDAEQWTPIGKYGSPSYKGAYYGSEHSISGVYINSSSNYQGLFTYVSSETNIQDLNVINSSIKGRQYVGGIIGYGANAFTITNCSFSGNIEATSDYSGGIIGYVYNASNVNITGCGSNGKIVGKKYVGGITGYGGMNTKDVNDYKLTITGCYNNAEIQGDISVGGIIGEIPTFNRSNYILTECHNSGDIIGNGYIGGILGNEKAPTTTDIYRKRNFNKLYNTGNIQGEKGEYFGRNCRTYQ